jgi:hypothetical protein
MKTYYVRPRSDAGYGNGDGSSYEHAWNGVEAVDWRALQSGEPAQLWLCGDPQGPGGFLTVFVEKSYLESPESATGPFSRRESPQPV